MNPRLSGKGRSWLALTTGLLLLIVAALVAPLSAELAIYARGLEFTILAATLITAVAFLVALPLGVLAGSGPRIVDTVLKQLCDLVGSLPSLFVAAVLWAWAGHAITYVCALGALRGLELGWLLRSELVRLESAVPDDERRSLRRLPLAVFLRRYLPSSLGPVFASASFSVAWFVGLDAALALTRLRPVDARPSWGVLLGETANSSVTLLAAGSVALLTVALHALFRPPQVSP
ncbi:MAG TPA: ABC transporter permease subunit [Polyangiaceae bacterium]|jgi:peptide/nickel transport system permease protein